MTVTFGNGQSLRCLGVHGRKINYQGVSRDSLTFLFPTETDLETLISVFVPENCKVIGLLDETEGEATADIHEHYTIRTKLGSGFQDVALGVFDVQNDTQVNYVTMAQATEAERMLQSQQETIELLLINTLEGGVN